MGKRFAIIGFGEAGQTFSRAGSWANAQVYDVKTDDNAQSVAMYKTYEDHGVKAGKSLADILPGAEFVLSLVTAEQSLSVANAAAKYISAGTYYFDMNSVSPESKREAAKVVSAADAQYVDAAIMAPVNPRSLFVPLLLSGQNAERGSALLSGLGFSNINIVGDQVGKASSIKMLRSVMIKGVEALTAECAIAADRAGVTEDVFGSMGADWPEKADYKLDRMMVHGVRRAAEMEEVVKTLEDLGVEPVMSRGTVRCQREIGLLRLNPPPKNLTGKLKALNKTQEETSE